MSRTCTQPIFVNINNQKNHQPPTSSPRTSSTNVTRVEPTTILIQLVEELTLAPNPCYVRCPFCQNSTLTRIQRTPSNKTHVIAIILCLLQLYCCVCMPYCIAGFMSTVHYCGICKKYLGTHCP